MLEGSTSAGAGERSAALRRVLGNHLLRRVVLVSGGFVTAEIGAWITLTVIAFRFGGVDEASQLLVAQLLPAAVAALFVGSAITRRGTTWVLAVGFWAQSIGLTIAAVSLALDAPRMVVYFGAVIAAIAVVSTRPAVAAALPTMVEQPSELTAANVVIGWVTAAATMLGPLIAAATLGIGAGAVPLAIFAVVAAASGAISGRLPSFRPRPEPGTADPRRIGRALHAGPPLLAVVVLASAALVVGCLDLLYVVIAVDVLDADSSLAGWLSTSAGAGAILGGVAAMVLVGRRSLWPWVVLAGLFSAAALAALGASPGSAAAALTFAAIQFGVTFLVIAARTLLQRLSDLDLLAHLAAIAESAEMAMLLLGAILVPALVHWFSPTRAGAAVGVVLVVAVTTCSLFLAGAEAAHTVPVRRLDLVRSCHLFGLLSAPAIETLASAAESVHLSEGEVLFHEGEVGDRYFIVAAGEVALSWLGQPLATMHRGQGFGELALRHQIGRTATATAIGPVDLLAIDGAIFLFAVTGRPESAEPADDSPSHGSGG